MNGGALRAVRGVEVSVARCPVALASLLAYRVVTSLLVALPLALAVGHLLGSISDAELFEPGGFVLSEVVRLARPYVAFGVSASLLLFVLVAWLELIPLAGLLVALRHEGPRRAGLWVPPAFRAWPTLSLLWGVASLLQATLGGGAMWAAWSIARTLGEGPARDIGMLVLAIPALLIALAIGIVHDASRVRAAGEGAGAWDAMRGAVRLFADHRGRLCLGYAWRMTAGVAGWAAALAAASFVGVTSTGAFLLGAGLHMIALACLVVARASWLALLTRCDAA